LVRAPASWNSIALETCSSASISADGARECCERAFIVLDDAAEGEDGRLRSSENRDVLGPCSVDGLPGSSEGLLGSKDRVFSGRIEDVEGLEGGEGGAAP
jgi:hypothetical protein